MRVRVYVDGFNLYYRALKHSPYKWLNVLQLARDLLAPDDTIDAVRYFTARVSPRAGNPSAPRDQQVYLSALGTIPEIEIHYGRFLPKNKWRPIVHPAWEPPVMVQVHDTEEKGSDVNLAVHMLNDGLTDKYDAALLMSQDTDLCECMRLVQEAGKVVGLVCLDGRQPNKRLSANCSFIRHVTSARLAAAQFPHIVAKANGDQVAKPDGW